MQENFIDIYSVQNMLITSQILSLHRQGQDVWMETF